MSYSKKHTQRRRTVKPMRGGEAHSAIFSPAVAKVGGGSSRKQKRASEKRRKNARRMRRTQKGGVTFPASFSNVPIRSFYPMNDFKNDPNYLTVAARNTGSFYGGRGKKRGGGAIFNPASFITGLRNTTASLYSPENPPKE